MAMVPFLAFYKGEITDDQRAIAKRTRTLVEKAIGRYSTLKSYSDPESGAEEKLRRRAHATITRPLVLQWIISDPSVAETSFFNVIVSSIKAASPATVVSFFPYEY